MGALDVILSTPFAAYSLYKLRDVYAGPCLRVIRASDNTQQDIGFDGNFIDTASLAAFCAGTTGYCHTWYDQMESYDYFTYANGSARAPEIYRDGAIATDGTQPSVVADPATGRWFGTNVGPGGISQATTAYRGRWRSDARGITAFGSSESQDQSGMNRWQIETPSGTKTWTTQHGLNGQYASLGFLFATDARVLANGVEALGSTSGTAGEVDKAVFSIGPGTNFGGGWACDTAVFWSGDTFSDLSTFFASIEKDQIKQTLRTDALHTWTAGPNELTCTDPALTALPYNGAVIDSAGLTSTKASLQFALAPGNEATHVMSNTTWVIRFRRTNTDNGCILKVGWKLNAEDTEERWATNRGWGIGFGGTAFEVAGENLLFLREGSQWHNFGAVAPAVGEFCVITIEMTNVVTIYVDGVALPQVSVAIGTVASRYIQFGGYESSSGGNRFSSSTIKDVMQLPRLLTTDERTWLQNEDNLLTDLWTPAEIDTALWLDAADETTLFDATSGGALVAADGAVARWEDKSGNARHVTQGTAGARPLKKASEQNGLSVVRFDGLNDLLKNESANLLNSVSEWSIFLVAKPSDLSGSRNLFNVTTSANSARVGIFFDSLERISLGGRKLASNSFAFISGTVSRLLNYVLITGVGDIANTDLDLYENGEVSASSASWLVSGETESSGGSLWIGSNSIGTDIFDGDLTEFIIPSTATSPGDRQKIEGYLAHKWGLTANLPIDHPYKTSPPVRQLPRVAIRRRRALQTQVGHVGIF